MSWFSAPPPSQRWAFALTALVTVSSGPLHAQTPKKTPRTEDPNAPTVVQAEDWFDDDVDWAEAGVEALCANLVVTQGEFDALVAFAFNVGVGKFKKSTLLRKFVGGDIPGAAAEFPKWCHSNGKVYDDLVKRRAQEVEWFNEA